MIIVDNHGSLHVRTCQKVTRLFLDPQAIFTKMAHTFFQIPPGALKISTNCISLSRNLHIMKPLCLTVIGTIYVDNVGHREDQFDQLSETLVYWPNWVRKKEYLIAVLVV